jgi:hypothetical protein
MTQRTHTGPSFDVTLPLAPPLRLSSTPTLPPSPGTPNGAFGGTAGQSSSGSKRWKLRSNSRYSRGPRSFESSRIFALQFCSTAFASNSS